MTDSREMARFAILNLENTLVEDLLNMSDEELLADCLELGMDVEKEAAQIQKLIERTAGRARMLAAKEEMAAYRSRGASHGKESDTEPANDVREARLTLAARNGEEQTEKDIESVAHDLAELSAFEGKLRK